MRNILTHVRTYASKIYSIILKWNVISVRNCDTKSDVTKSIPCQPMWLFTFQEPIKAWSNECLQILGISYFHIKNKHEPYLPRQLNWQMKAYLTNDSLNKLYSVPIHWSTKEKIIPFFVGFVGIAVIIFFKGQC